nr:energy-coupled thiamine transporter ThiT [Lachnospiraceae bacterium]
QLVFAGVSLAIAFVLSFVKLVHLPWGGSVTLCSMLFVAIIGYWYGPKIGLISALAYGFLQFVQEGGGYILSPMQVAFDYVLAFASLGVSGFFNKKKNGLIIGYVVAILLRGLMHAIGGYIYWMDYMPDNFPKNLAALYPVLYNYAYIIPEGVITVVLLLLAPVKKGIAYITGLARAE